MLLPVPEPLEALGIDKYGEAWLLWVVDEGFGPTFYAWPASLPPDRHPRHLAKAAVTTRHLTSQRKLERAKIEDIQVDPPWRNRGVGTLLLRCLEEWCGDRGFRQMWGEISKVDADHLDELQHIYTKNGYKFELYARPRGIMIGETFKAL